MQLIFIFSWIFPLYFMFILSPEGDVKSNTGGQRTHCAVTCRDPSPAASWLHPETRGGQWDLLPSVRSRLRGLFFFFFYSNASPGIQLMANIKAAPGVLEQLGCGWRSSPMNSARYVGQTPSARWMNAHYQFMEALNTHRSSLFLSLSTLVFKGSWALFFSKREFQQFKLPLNDKPRVPRWKEEEEKKGSRAFEASRPLHLFDQPLGCEFCRSESGSEAPRGPPFTPATGRG